MSGRSDAEAARPGISAIGRAPAPAHADVLIAGASFAGLAVAREVRGHAVLVDPAPVGDGQTSACGAPESVIEALGARGSIQQRHDALILHLPGRAVRWPLPEPFCTFDYRRCCTEALAGIDARVIRASVLDRHGSAVVTTAGEIHGRILVDCTGWRAALAGAGRRPHGGGPAPRHYFGLEAEVPARFPPGLHFYFWPEIVRDGYAWAFPAGEATRIGLLSYRGRTKLSAGLTALLARLRMPGGPLHGGYLRTGLHAPVLDGVFVVGDAGGQCLPLTGEGIRTAVWAGQASGRLIHMVLAGHLSLDEARVRYRALVVRQRRRYRALRWATLGVRAVPWHLLGLIASWVSRPGPLDAVMRRYLGIFSEYSGIAKAR